MRTVRVNNCGHPEREHVAKGMCRQCYGHAYKKVYNVENRDRVIATTKAWRASHVAERQEYRRAYHAAHLVEEVEYSKQWTKDHPGYSKARRLADPDRFKGYAHTRMARKRDASIDPFTASELTAHIEEMGGRCVYCDGPYEHLDHVYPLSRGGPHGLNNLVPCCKPCNLAKNNKLPLQWLIRDGVAL